MGEHKLHYLLTYLRG